MQRPDKHEVTRRDFLAAGTASAAVFLLPPIAKGQQPADDTPAPPATEPTVLSKVSFTVNGKPCELELDTRTTLLDALREHLHLTGSKKGCDQGQCGACTVITGGRRTLSCLTLAV